MKKFGLFSVMALFVLSAPAWAGVASGEGYGPNRADAADKAKRAAIAATRGHKVNSVAVDACDQGSNGWWTCTATANFED